MAEQFDLIIDADDSTLSAEFRLFDAAGVQVAANTTRFADILPSTQRGLFDLHGYLRVYHDKPRHAAEAAAIGVCIAEQVLGKAIFEALWQSQAERTLRIQLPGAAQPGNRLAALLASVPWEIARPAPGQPTLAERNLLVRLVHRAPASATAPLVLQPNEALRVLFVFAEAHGSTPLDARSERRELQRLFTEKVYPNRRVEADFLTHGVTRERLAEQLTDRGGYHIVHWSGHGNLDLLELCRPDGESDRMSGAELHELLVQSGTLPSLVFLSACHSGDVRVNDWDDFAAIAAGHEPEARAIAARDLDMAALPAFTGTAHALLAGGVDSVVAMRYAVGDDYARELAKTFYMHLLADTEPKAVAKAPNLARKALLNPTRDDFDRFGVCDHANAVLYGHAAATLTPASGRSTALKTRHRRIPDIAELSSAAHTHFVGRTWELARLGARHIGASQQSDLRPVALITGLGGMGKTALTAEALALWETRFDWVLLYQAKPSPLDLEGTLRDIDMRLAAELGVYYQHRQAHPADAIHREATPDFAGAERLDRLMRNLLRALQDEAILLVLDNFETNLKDAAEPDSPPGRPAWACQDPAWDRCLQVLSTGLIGGRSRLLITSRRPLAALANGAAHIEQLGPLPAGEAALYLRGQPALSAMLHSADKDERKLAKRLLAASRFHPLLMDRLARLAANTDLRPKLVEALETLEKRAGFDRLPELFAAAPGDHNELAYLGDALNASLDQLIGDLSADARRLLWVIAVANQPEALGLVENVWRGEDTPQRAQLRHIKQMLDMLPQLPPELRDQITELATPELRAMLDDLPPEAEARPDLAPLLSHLVSIGLVSEERDGPDNENPNLACHELVRERIRAWMARHPEDCAELTENAVRLAYAERLEAVFDSLLHKDMTAALQAGSRALVYCVQAEAWDRLGSFASDLATGTQDPLLLRALLPHLSAAAAAAPAGRMRWVGLGTLASAVYNAGQPDASLPYYELAAAQARAAAEAGEADARQAWSDFAVIVSNWAAALLGVGQLDAARQRLVDSAEAARRAGRPEVNVVGSELEALRIDTMQGKAEKALPEVEQRLARMEGWWRRHRAGKQVAEAPDPEVLARAYISALDIAGQAHLALEDWDAALLRVEAVLEAEHVLNRPAEDIAATRMNRADLLAKLDRRAEARTEMEACLGIFQHSPANHSKVLSSLASLAAAEGDVAQAISLERRSLAQREKLPDPRDRAQSHGNLANHLDRRSTPTDRAEPARHMLAALVYFLVAGMRQYLQTSLRNYAVDFRRASGAGTEPDIPSVAELLADPAFDSVKTWLAQRQVDLGELQTAVDQFLAMARQKATEFSRKPTPPSP